MSKVTNKVYNGKISLMFDTFRHQYSVDGEIIPGVTSILDVLSKPALIWWSANVAADYFRENIKPGVALDELQIESIWQRAKKAHTQKKSDAASLGSLVHQFAEDYINKKTPTLPVNEQARGSVERFLNWGKDNNVEFLLAEQPIFSRRHRYAGTTDFICRMNGELWLGDIKTSNSYRSTYASQCSAYLQARVEEFPEEVYSGAIIVRVGKEDGEIEIIKKTNVELLPYQKLFMACLDTYNAIEEIKKVDGDI